MPLFSFLSARVTSISAVDGIWHHICATWENTAGSWKLFKDGVVAADGQGLNRGERITIKPHIWNECLHVTFNVVKEPNALFCFCLFLVLIYA